MMIRSPTLLQALSNTAYRRLLRTSTSCTLRQSRSCVTNYNAFRSSIHRNTVASSLTHNYSTRESSDENELTDKVPLQHEEKEATGNKESEEEVMEFQAETRQLLDIVTNSLYTDKEVFLRELISNASDSLEKLRHIQAASSSIDSALIQPDLGLEIRIELDEVASSITITDTGIGMTKDEMKENLGTIAKSGSKAFVQGLKQMQTTSEVEAASRGIIGKFGVGFYSSFMVGRKVEVRSLSAKGDEPAHVWTSEGAGNYTIAPLDPSIRQDRGSSIVIYLKEEFWPYCDEKRIQDILKRYSNFVNFPIHVNGKRLNTIQAIWTLDPREVEEDTYTEFYKYIANAIDDPLDTCHFRIDAPIDLKGLLFTPSFHSEKFGMGRMEPGVSLYSRKVLIEQKSTILPDWLRFLKGVVDSEDLPLAISREKAQDSALLSKIRRALTRKYLSHLAKLVKKEKEVYLDEFYKEYSFFLKEGVCQDFDSQSELTKLLYFETNKSSDLKSFDEYISSMPPEQKEVFYLVSPTREAALTSPYLEAFDSAGVEVILLYSTIDDFVMANIEKYEGRPLVGVEKSEIDLSDISSSEPEKPNLYRAERELSSGESTEFCQWFKSSMESKVLSCVATSRLSSSPAIVVDNESGSMRRMMRLIDTGNADKGRDGVLLAKQRVEINPKHALIVGIYDLIKTEPALAKVLAEQIYDNCLMAAGLLDDSRSIIPRLNDILLCVINGAKKLEAEKSIVSTAAETVTDQPADSLTEPATATVIDMSTTTTTSSQTSTTIEVEPAVKTETYTNIDSPVMDDVKTK